MSVSKEKLLAHLDDYFRVTDRKTDQFVCPITLRECNEHELIEGHILNEALKKASRRRIIQFGEIDHFYGTRFESGLVRFLNLGHESELNLLCREHVWVEDHEVVGENFEHDGVVLAGSLSSAEDVALTTFDHAHHRFDLPSRTETSLTLGTPEVIPHFESIGLFRRPTVLASGPGGMIE